MSALRERIAPIPARRRESGDLKKTEDDVVTGDRWRAWRAGRILEPRYVEWGVDLLPHYRPSFAGYRQPRWASRIGPITCELPMPMAQTEVKVEVIWPEPVRAQTTTSLLELEALVWTGDLGDEDTTEVPIFMKQKQAKRWITEKL